MEHRALVVRTLLLKTHYWVMINGGRGTVVITQAKIWASEEKERLPNKTSPTYVLSMMVQICFLKCLTLFYIDTHHCHLFLTLWLAVILTYWCLLYSLYVYIHISSWLVFVFVSFMVLRWNPNIGLYTHSHSASGVTVVSVFNFLDNDLRIVCTSSFSSNILESWFLIKCFHLYLSFCVNFVSVHRLLVVIHPLKVG